MTHAPSSEHTGYKSATFALLTQHGKELVIAPVVREAFDGHVVLVSRFDTDTLGTFTRDTPRAGNQLEAARKKAHIGLELSGLPLALASEGSFAPGLFGLGSWNLELVVLVDELRGIEIVGHAYQPGLHEHALVKTDAELGENARRAKFPEHGLVLRPDGENDPRVRKGLRDLPELVDSFRAAKSESLTGAVFVENDLRAHMHPTRMSTIKAATRNLAERMRSLCAACDSPGFGFRAPIPGLPCRECGHETEQARADEYRCVACEHREERPRDKEYAEPHQCSYCNP